jgi:hypothetical protein
MEDPFFQYILSDSELAYWMHSSEHLRSWYQAEMKGKARALASATGHTHWIIFAPDESSVAEGFIQTVGNDFN